VARLILFKGTSAERSFPLGETPAVIGRQPPCNIQILDAKASRKHCEIHQTDKGFELSDLGSRNATFVNGVSVTKTMLSNGDQVRVGNTVMEFESDELNELTPSTIAVTDDGDSDQLTIVQASINVKEAGLLDPDTDRLDMDQLRRAEKALAVLYDGAQLLASRRNEDELLESVSALALDLTGGERAFVALLREDGALEIKATWSATGQEVSPQMALSKSIASVALGEKNAVLCADTQSDARFRDRQSIYMQQIRSAIYVPLASHEKVLGLLGVDSANPSVKFSKDHLRHLSILTNHAAAAVENLRLQEEAVKQQVMEQQLEIAREIQQNFLPADLNVIPQMEIAASSLPAMLVGGDFYDCIPLDAQRTILSIGDVSGKGVPAALCMGRVMGDIKSLVALHDQPSDVLAVLNSAFLKRSTRGMFISLLLLTYDATTGKCVMCNAGHPAPLVIRSDSTEPEFIEERGGPIVGIVDEADYGNYEFALNPGDMLVLYTDGISEAQNKKEEFFSAETMALEVFSRRRASCEEIIEAVFDRVAAFAGQEIIDDDLTMVALRVKAEG